MTKRGDLAYSLLICRTYVLSNLTGVASPSFWVESSDPRSLVGSADLVLLLNIGGYVKWDKFGMLFPMLYVWE